MYDIVPAIMDGDNVLFQSAPGSEKVTLLAGNRAFSFFLHCIRFVNTIAPIIFKVSFVAPSKLCLLLIHIAKVLLLQDLVQMVTNDFKTGLREENLWLLFAPTPVHHITASV